MDPEMFNAFCERIVEATKKYIFQEAILKPLKDKLLKLFLRGVENRIKIPFSLTDDQAVKAFYIGMITLFGLLTLYLSGSEKLDLLARLAMLSCASATIVGVVFYGLVSANVRSR